jgi:hypothetical protein
MKAYGGNRFIAPPFLTSALDGGEWSAVRPDRFTPGESVLDTHWIGGLVVPRTGLSSMMECCIPVFQGHSASPSGERIRCTGVGLS